MRSAAGLRPALVMCFLHALAAPGLPPQLLCELGAFGDLVGGAVQTAGGQRQLQWRLQRTGCTGLEGDARLRIMAVSVYAAAV